MTITENLEQYKYLSNNYIKRLQLYKLKRCVSFHYQNNKKYKAMMQASGVTPESIQSLQDLVKLPIITPIELSQDRVNDFYSVDSSEIATYLETSGSTGRPKIIPVSYTERDIIFEQGALMYRLAGIGSTALKNGRSSRSIYSLFPFGPWPGQFFLQHSGEELASTIRADIRMPMEWHKERLTFFKPADLVTYPSFISFLYESLKKDVDFLSLDLNRIVLAGEPFTESYRHKIETLFGTEVYDLYGCGEIGVAAAECTHSRKSGYMHWYSPNLILEVVNPQTQKHVSDGELGEMIVTNLWRTSVPIIRYKMGDLISTTTKKCPCDINLPLVSRISGRADETFQYGAASIYPSQIFDAIASAGIGDKFQVRIKYTIDKLSEKIILLVEESENINVGEAKIKINNFLRQLSPEFEQIVYGINFRPEIEVILVENGTLFKQSQTKLKRIFDERI
ncbi:phenylacetate--CoA ligase family protein [Microbulbifer epialgicus]|uniref:Phenylacetate--CoA ligase family protein n=1 Tax=Microbulbifer epialgicus TaxID=393907 RepID=A0ABV4P4J2_9GAMM